MSFLFFLFLFYFYYFFYFIIVFIFIFIFIILFKRSKKKFAKQKKKTRNKELKKNNFEIKKIRKNGNFRNKIESIWKKKFVKIANLLLIFWHSKLPNLSTKNDLSSTTLTKCIWKQLMRNFNITQRFVFFSEKKKRKFGWEFFVCDVTFKKFDLVGGEFWFRFWLQNCERSLYFWG